MEHLFAVQHLERIEDRSHDLSDAFFGKGFSPLGKQLAQRLPLIESHRHIGRSVAFPEAKHLHQCWVREFRKQFGFVDEALQSRLKRALMIGRAHGDAHAVDATCEGRGHEFFQSDDAIQRRILGQVDDAETTLTDQSDDLEVSDARADRETVGMRC